MAATFEVAKVALQVATLLVYPKRQAELALMVDASAEHVGAALQQRTTPAAAWQPLSSFLKKLDPTQKKEILHLRPGTAGLHARHPPFQVHAVGKGLHPLH